MSNKIYAFIMKQKATTMVHNKIAMSVFVLSKIMCRHHFQAELDTTLMNIPHKILLHIVKIKFQQQEESILKTASMFKKYSQETVMHTIVLSTM